jgi:hypothetical protein
MSARRESGTVSRILTCLILMAASAGGAVHAAEPVTDADRSRPEADEQVPAEPQATIAVASATPGDRVVDRLRLDATAITGNRELPKVMSIVPWKPAEPPVGPERPMGSLIEELLAPVDRDEFRREITYYRDLTSQSSEVDMQATGLPAAAIVPEQNRASPSSSPGASIP